MSQACHRRDGVAGLSAATRRHAGPRPCRDRRLRLPRPRAAANGGRAVGSCVDRSWIEGRGGVPPLPCRNQQPGVQMAQQRESGSSGSQLLQHGRANALRLTLRPNPNAKQASNTLVRDFLFIAFSYADGTTGALLPPPSGAPTADAVQRGAPRLLPRPIGPAMRRSPSQVRISQCLLASLLDGASAHQRRQAPRRGSLQGVGRRITLMHIGRADRRCRRFNGGQTGRGPARRRRPKTGTRRFVAARRPPRPRAGFAKRDGDETACPSGCGHPCVPWRLRADPDAVRTLAA